MVERACELLQNILQVIRIKFTIFKVTALRMSWGRSDPSLVEVGCCLKPLKEAGRKSPTAAREITLSFAPDLGCTSRVQEQAMQPEKLEETGQVASEGKNEESCVSEDWFGEGDYAEHSVPHSPRTKIISPARVPSFASQEDDVRFGGEESESVIRTENVRTQTCNRVESSSVGRPGHEEMEFRRRIHERRYWISPRSV